MLITLCISCEATHKMHTKSFIGHHAAKADFPIPVGFINDFDNILSDEQETALLDVIQQYKTETNNEIVIVTLTSIQDYTGLVEYSLDLANHWDVGQKEKNNGVLIALYMKDRRVWIHNGVGVMHKLTDEESLDIINTIIVPEFKKNDFYNGFQKGIKAVIDELDSH
ncbi:YgcG family protein [uncultured Kordia sp.]|uniref:TPM domain-containing protein n=1 Tax=uncultured Kordia sp. TaxID=507699 RepID=UPI00261D3173|nr:TPM domain-containing protein [uncultured Kordia sp.]